MAFLGLMWVREHEAVVGATITRLEASLESKDKTIERLCGERDNARASERNLINLSKAGTSSITAYAQEVADLRAELATLKAERERRLAPLAAANAARKAKAQAARGGDLREGV